jgi:phage tail sheath protein FI
MAQSFLHGVETIIIDEGSRAVQEVKTAVIGLCGIAPEGPKNKCVLVKNDVDAAVFGKQLPGFDIPQSLSQIFSQGAGLVIVVNVYDETLHTTQIIEELQTVASGKLKLSAAPLGTVTIKNQDGTASNYVKGTDYQINEFGLLTVIAGRIPDNTTLKFDFKKLNPAAVTNAHIIGTVDNAGNRTGIKAWDLAFNTFGFRPKILIAPGRSASKPIADELALSAERLRAVAPIDSTYGADVTVTIANRGNPATAFGSSNKRLIPLYPYLKGYDISKDDGNTDTDTNTDFPYSSFFAGVMALTDKNFGYWFSPSNKELNNVTGVERPISANLNDENTDANLLNAAGITTVFNTFGTGYRTWGNRNASFPTNTQVDNFIALLRTFDVVHESLEQAALQFIDRPITQALVDDIRQRGNNFCKVLIGRGALTEGSRVVYNKGDNSAEQLAAGQITFRIIKMGNTPAERITYKSTIDITLLKASIK